MSLLSHDTILEHQRNCAYEPAAASLYHRSGDRREAIDSYRNAADLRRMIGDRYAEAETLSRLDDTHRAGGDSGAARAVWLEALSVLDKLGHTDAEGVRAKLAAL